MMLTCLAMHVLCSVIILVCFLELVYAGQSILQARLYTFTIQSWIVDEVLQMEYDSNIHT